MRVESDAELLALVWSNLLSNAFKFTPPGGRVSVGLTERDGRVLMRVADTGCGISREAGAHIFEKFYQADPSRATRGNGLGLALVKRVMDIVGGDISVRSEVGKGSEFTVALPGGMRRPNLSKARKIVKKLFCLPPLPTVLAAVPSFALVIYVLSRDETGTLAYTAYLASAYALVVSLTGLPRIARRRYRLCGWILLWMNAALAGMVSFLVKEEGGYDYPGVLIYAMAAYAFYAVITAVISLFQYRKYGSPLLSAAQAVGLVAAMVSMLALETALLSRFGKEDAAFRGLMTSITGGVVCTLVLGMAVFMLIRSTRQLRRLKPERE